MYQLKFLCSVKHDLGLKTPGVTPCLTNAIRSTFGMPVIALRPGSRTTTGMFVYIIWLS